MFEREKSFSRRYACHVKHVARARALVNTSPPILHAGAFLKFKEWREHGETYLQTMKGNARCIRIYCRVMGTRGKLDTFHHKYAHNFYPTERNLYQRRKLVEKIQEENVKFGLRLLSAKSKVATSLNLSKMNQPKSTFKLPTQILQKYDHIEVPRCASLQRKLLRPEVYMEIGIKNVRPLGKLLLQLYTEAAPQVVWKFTEMASANQKHNIKITRLFPNLWLEGEIPLEKTSAMVCQKLEFDKRAIDHESGCGILSFPESYLNGFRHGLLNFAISFKPLKVLNGRRVAFGRMLIGRKILESLKDYGTKMGRPLKEIVVLDYRLK